MSTTMNKNTLLAVISNLEAQLATLRLAVGQVPDVAPAPVTKPKKAGRPSKTAATSEPTSAPAATAEGEVKPKVKRALPDNIAAMNTERNNLFTKMRNEWMDKNPTLAEAAKAAWAEDASKAAKKAFADAVKASNAERPPQYPDVLKAYSLILAERNPALAAAKAAKKAAKAASETGSEASTKKRGRPKMTDEEKAAKKAAKKAAPAPAPSAADTTSVASSDTSAKKRGRPKMTDEQKAAAKAARKAKASAEKAATVPLPGSPPDTDFEDDSLE